MFRRVSFLLMGLSLAVLAGIAEAEPAIIVNGAPLGGSRPVVNRLGVTLLPMRPVLEALGARAQWWPKEQKLQVRRGERIVELWIGTPVAQVDRVPVQLEVPPLLIGGTTYLPIRLVAQALRAGVRWDPVTRQITISTSPLPLPAQ